MIVLKATKNHDFTVSLKNTFLEKPQGGVKLTPLYLNLLRISFKIYDVTAWLTSN